MIFVFCCKKREVIPKGTTPLLERVMGILRCTASIASHTLVATSAKTSLLPPCSIPINIKTKALTQKVSAFIIGAGDGNRTHTTSLEGWDSSH